MGGDVAGDFTEDGDGLADVLGYEFAKDVGGERLKESPGGLGGFGQDLEVAGVGYEDVFL